MVCTPNTPGNPGFYSNDFTSGNNFNATCPDCQNNPARSDVGNAGPIPSGSYTINPQNPGGSSRRNLAQNQSYAGRTGNFQTHGCSNPNTCSQGCIAATNNATRDYLNNTLSLEEGRNTLNVLP